MAWNTKETMRRVAHDFGFASGPLSSTPNIHPGLVSGEEGLHAEVLTIQMNIPPASDQTASPANYQREVIAEFSQAALNADEIEHLLRDASTAIAETLDADRVAVLELLPGGDEAILSHGHGWPDGVVGSKTVPVSANSQAEYVLQKTQLITVTDVESESRFDVPELLSGDDSGSTSSILIGSVENPWGLLWFHTKASSVVTEQDAAFVQSIVNILATAIDATQTRDRFEEIYGRISDAFYGLDEEWEFTHINEQAHALINPEDRKLEGKYVWDEFQEATSRKFKPKFEEAMNEQRTVTFEEYYPDPLDSWFEVRVYPSDTGLSVYFRDITDQKLRRDKIADRNQVLRNAYEIIADDDQTVSEQLDALLAIVREHLGTDYATFSHIQSDQYEFERVAVASEIDLAAGESTDLVELPICEQVFQTGETLVMSDVAAKAPELVDQEWGITCYLGTPVEVNGSTYGTFCFYDVEPRSKEFSEWDQTFVELLGNWVGSKLSQQQTTDELQRQNERLEEFANVVSHDLRNPLNVAEGRLELAREESDSDHLEEIEAAHTRIKTLIEDLLALAREGEDITVDSSVEFSTLIDNCWSTVETDNATLINDIDRTVRADRSRLKQLFENLFRNAVEHGGDDVTISIGAFSNGFFIADDGPGISSAESEDVFEAGFSTETDGTGFGLSIAKQIAEAHDWRIDVTESEDGGARFEISGVEFVAE